ncbi:lysosomal cholesterol signaling protein isoform X2 [Latimeria chalumnae]|uniref:lysosomal cholesterol signaling protein isoform X2 n=1 Tax=Latimeria chalumnae TaxID=7897 RepID=UPI00313B4CE8
MSLFFDIGAKNALSSNSLINSSTTKPGSPLDFLENAPSPMSIDRLFPALLECFGIILCGYVAGRANIITPTQAKGLGNFVSTFALPALLFKNMVLLNFAGVSWSFLLSVLIAKVVVFVIVCALTLLVASPDSRFSKAGLFPIFTTQSNDFALGFPIVEALYKSTHPEYLQYIYLVAPVSLMMLNPIGFIFCEVQKWKENRNTQQSKLKIVGLALLRVFRNPIVSMVVIGIVSNFLLGNKIPVFMEQFLDGLANSFGGSALFYLGLSMVGQIKKLRKSTFVALILLITAKLLVLPLICREMVEFLDKSKDKANHTSLSNYAFLYGVFPTAPSVAIYAGQYNMEMEILTSGMVISTFISAPIMYVSAWLLTIPSMDPKLLISAVQNVSFDISIVSLISLIWSVAVIFLSKKYKRLPHFFTANLMLAQFTVCIGMIVWNFIIKQSNQIMQIFVFIVLYSSLYSTYLWTGLIALSLFLLKKRDELSVPSGICIIASWGIPAFILGFLLIVEEPNRSENIDSAFFYGKSQIISTAVVLSISIVTAGISLMGMSRNGQERNYQLLDPDAFLSSAEGLNSQNNQEPQTLTPTAVSGAESSIKRECCACQMENKELCHLQEPMPDVMITHSNQINATESGQCVNRCASENCMLAEEEQLLQNADRQLARHVLLCLLLVIGLLANLSSCLWWLFNKEPGSLYVELQFFCAVFNFGQGFISFGIFGLDKHLIIIPCKKRLEFLWGGRETTTQSNSTVSEEIQLTCQQFAHYHKDQCVTDIVRERRKCFTEHVRESFL